MLLVLLILPFAAAGIALAIPSNRWRPWLLPIAAAGHLGLTIDMLRRPCEPLFNNWLALDDLGRTVLLLVSVLFAASAVYAIGYLRHEAELPNRMFCGSLLAFLGTMTLLACSHHWGLMWVAMEATTLASAPLIYFSRTKVSLEATWKYLLLCSVGIAIALLGSFFLAYAAVHEGLPASLVVSDLLAEAPRLARPWLQAAFVLLLVGYGTKMGLAPMHTWLPDAHGEAPAPVSALLSGALLPCAFVPILRGYQLCTAAGNAAFTRPILLVMGLLSMAVAGLMILRQRDLKRMLAYSSVEQMGILAVGMGIGGAAVFAVLLHMLGSGLAKSLLFLSTGNIYHAYGSKSIADVSGVLRRLPLTGLAMTAGLLAITGSPPFGPFVSTFAIVNSTLSGGHFGVAAVFLLLLFVVFLGMGATVLAAVQGRPSQQSATGTRHGSLAASLPLVVLLAMVLGMGIAMPDFLRELVSGAARLLEMQT
jgi:hydrogenase-4 component F